MTHEEWCDRRFHIDYNDGSDPGPCVGEAAMVDTVGAYLKASDAGTMIAFIPMPMGALIPLHQATKFVNDLAVLVAKGTGHS